MILEDERTRVSETAKSGRCLSGGVEDDGGDAGVRGPGGGEAPGAMNYSVGYNGVRSNIQKEMSWFIVINSKPMIPSGTSRILGRSPLS